MKSIEELANSTGNEMTDREKAICLLAWLRANPKEAGKLCKIIGISREVAIQSALDVNKFMEEIF